LRNPTDVLGRGSDLMERTIGAFEVRRQFGRMLSDIVSRGDRYVVERHGQPVAVVVPLSVYEQWKRSREAFFDQMEAAGRRANLTPEEADAAADEAVAAVRAENRHRTS
jgi:prevent-host-death family protein